MATGGVSLLGRPGFRLMGMTSAATGEAGAAEGLDWIFRSFFGSAICPTLVVDSVQLLQKPGVGEYPRNV